MCGRTYDVKKQILLGAGALALAAVPAVIGLWGNASFAESVPVRVPTSGQVATLAPSPVGTPTPSPSAVDDHGGEVPRDQRVEPGDDRDQNGGLSESNGGSGVDDSRHGGDDHGGDDHGGDDHGGDD
jgi:hypothetical protein